MKGASREQIRRHSETTHVVGIGQGIDASVCRGAGHRYIACEDRDN